MRVTINITEEKKDLLFKKPRSPAFLTTVINRAKLAANDRRYQCITDREFASSCRFSVY